MSEIVFDSSEMGGVEVIVNPNGSHAVIEDNNIVSSYIAPTVHIPEYMTVKDPDYQASLRAGTNIEFKTPGDERDFYIMLGWNAAVSAMKGEPECLQV